MSEAMTFFYWFIAVVGVILVVWVAAALLMKK